MTEDDKVTEDASRSMLTQCKTCDGEISRKAMTCPHCGHPEKRRLRVVLIFMAILFIVFHKEVHARLNIPDVLDSLIHVLVGTSPDDHTEHTSEAQSERTQPPEHQSGQATQQKHEPEEQATHAPERAVAPTDDPEVHLGETEGPQANREEEVEPPETATMDTPALPKIDKINVAPAHQADEGAPEDEAPDGEDNPPTEAILQKLEPEIQLLAHNLKYSYEQQDNNGLRAMFYRGWEAFFQTADSITAVVRPEQTQVTGSHATVDVRVELTYQDEHKQNQHNTSTYTWKLAYKHDAWMLTGITVLL